MRGTVPWLAAMAIAFGGTFGAHAGLRRSASPPPIPAATLSSCMEGAFGNGAPQTFFALSATEVDSIVHAAASALNVDTATIAVVDRAGRVLAIFRQPNANALNDDQAVGVARTAAFFSHNMAPLSSRTVRFISGIHFPPGVVNASNAALYGIENTNRGCGFNTAFNGSKDVPPAKSATYASLPCDSTHSAGCGPGIVTGKLQPDDGPYPQDVGNRTVNAGGIPLYRLVPPGLDHVNEGIVSNGKVVGGIGVAGIAGDPQLAEFIAVTGAFGSAGIVPLPAYPLPDPGNVLIDGIRLPFLGPDQKLHFNSNGLPTGLELPAGSTAGASTAGHYVSFPVNGGCADNEDLVVAHASGSLSQAQVQLVVDRAIKAAKRTRGGIRLPLNSYARMVIAVTDLSGSLLALYRMPDATVFSIDVAVAKARNVVWFSSNPHDLPGVAGGTAVTNRTIGFGAQPLFPPGIDSNVFNVGAGPFYPLFLSDLAKPCSQGSDTTNPANQNGIVFFPGATPLYVNGMLAGGLGISGDGVEQDDYVTYLAAGGLPEESSPQTFLPDRKNWADRISINGVRLPMFKFPRQPEGVTECGGKPCS